MGVEEAPTSPAAPRMGVEEVTTTPVEEIMVCVVGVEEPPPASVGVNIHVTAPGRAEDSDFSSLPRTNSVSRWRNISRKKILIGLVFVAIALAIGLTVPLFYSRIDNPCIICPNGITAGDDFVPGASSGNSMMCLELINSSMENESGSQRCIALLSVYKNSCCPTTTATTPTPTKTPTETPTVDAMTPAPTSAPSDETTVAITTTTSSSAPETDDPCIICPNGATAGGDFAPYADDGDLRTCSDLIDEAKLYETGSDDCGLIEFHELLCCLSIPENPCNICPDGATAGDDYVPEFEGNTSPCSDLLWFSNQFESGSDACRLSALIVSYCCTSMPVDDTTDDTCIICPNGTDIDDFAPYVDDGDSRTCADLIDEAKLYETGSDDCGWFEFKELSCCYTIPDNPCNICPEGATAGDDYVPEYAGNSVNRASCKEIIELAKRFKSGSDACGLYDTDVAYCCPSPAPVDYFLLAQTTTPSDLGTDTGVNNPCIICPNGTDIDNFAPYVDDGDSRTCADLIDEAKLYGTGSDECGGFEFEELNCCYTIPENPCIICPDGATAGDDHVPEYRDDTATCSDLIGGAKQFESGSDACRLYDKDVAYCCPP
jgi:hypothetical protein